MRVLTKSLGVPLASVAVVLALLLPATAGIPALRASLSGDAEVPGPGDADGSGMANVTVRPRIGRVCFNIQVSDIALPATAAHIHRGVEGEAGRVKVTLEAPDEDGTSAGCLSDLSKKLLRRIKRHPANFYVNVHNAEFPGGAIRGQLERTTGSGS